MMAALAGLTHKCWLILFCWNFQNELFYFVLFWMTLGPKYLNRSIKAKLLYCLNNFLLKLLSKSLINFLQQFKNHFHFIKTINTSRASSFQKTGKIRNILSNWLQTTQIGRLESNWRKFVSGAWWYCFNRVIQLIKSNMSNWCINSN